MSSANKMIDFYADVIARLTGASTINISCCQGKLVESYSTSGEPNAQLLPEFDPLQPDIGFPNLNHGEKPIFSHSALHLTSIFKSQTKGSFLVYFNLHQAETTFTENNNDLSKSDERRDQEISLEQHTYSMWLGLTFTQKLPRWLSNDALEADPLSSKQFYPLLESILKLGYVLVNHLQKTAKLLRDPITLLSSRIEFQNNLSKLIEDSSQVAMIMINPADFQIINKKFGHDAGDRVIAEIAQILAKTLRKKDLISRFGGALFAIALPLKHNDDIAIIANKLYIKLQQPEYLQGAFSPQFKLGAAVIDAENETATATIADYVTELISKADQALHAAKTESKSNIVIWHPQKHQRYQQQQDYIGGIFTADTTTDYRNMLLLWDISNLIATYNQFDVLFDKVIQRLAQSFDFNMGGLLPEKNRDELNSAFHFEIDEQGSANRLQQIDKVLVNLLCDTTQSPDATQTRCIAINATEILFMAPFNEQGDGLFYLRGTISNLNLASDSQLLLTALVKQLGRAYTRALLEEKLNLQLFNQKEQLQAELDQLKQSLHSSEILYRSKAMDVLMKQAQRSATSDTTTLIIGESGTGKERLVHAIHQSGNRRDQPLVIVDCGAIPETLIESELFGHVKGAFTGATSNSKGRILDADGGTLMLDEIGEIPLKIQTKLLRFVQEKQFTPVGGTQTNKVNVKIIAVTNRDLQYEVNQGRFRQDLFYRLNVVVLQPPPLRERSEDIPLLAKHFLKKSALQHDESLKTLSPDALQGMLAYAWPGNIRELENCLIQATLLCESSQIEFSELKINLENGNNDTIEPLLTSASATIALVEDANIPDNSNVQLIAAQQENIIKCFNQAMAQYIRQIVQQSKAEASPVGRWLDNDLLLFTYQASQNNTLQVAMRLGLPHSTVRRRVNKITNEDDNHRVENWQQVMTALKPIIEGQLFLGNDTIKQLKFEMLQTVLIEVNNNATLAAALMGMSEPTFYKWKKEIVN